MELFVGFEANEIIYLEQNLLGYIRDAMRTVINQAKQTHHLTQFISKFVQNSSLTTYKFTTHSPDRLERNIWSENRDETTEFIPLDCFTDALFRIN